MKENDKAFAAKCVGMARIEKKPTAENDKAFTGKVWGMGYIGKMPETAPRYQLIEGVLYRRVLDMADKVKGAWFNDPYTTVKWGDGTTTTVRCHDGDEYDKEKGVLLCFAKRLFGGGKYNDALRKALGDE